MELSESVSFIHKKSLLLEARPSVIRLRVGSHFILQYGVVITTTTAGRMTGSATTEIQSPIGMTKTHLTKKITRENQV